MPSISYTPDAFVLAMAVGTTPTCVKSALQTLGVSVDRESEECQWAHTVEMRLVPVADLSFTVLNAFATDPATATYRLIPGGALYVINVRDGHEKVFFKAAIPTTMTVELYGSSDRFTPI